MGRVGTLKCERCNGTGEPTRADSDLATKCEACAGTGESPIQRNKTRFKDFLKTLQRRAATCKGIVWIVGDSVPKVILTYDPDNFTFTIVHGSKLSITEEHFQPEEFQKWFPVFSQQFYQLEHVKLWELL